MNKEKYIKIFAEVFEVPANSVENLEYQSIPEWDSVGHMTLMGELEEAFDITIDMEDIIDFSSFAKGIELLSKYGIEIDR